MLEFFNHTLLHQNFMPHGHCYLWQQQLLGLHLVSDLLIALAYYSIPALLIYVVHKRRDVPFSWIFLLFGAFIISCGTTHLMEVWTIWYPTYWLAGGLKAITAFISLYTAAELIPLTPKILSLPSPAQLEIANQTLVGEIAERQRAEEALHKINQELEIRVEARTAELRQSNEKLLQEVAERQRVEESLRAALQKLTFHFENTPLAVIEWDREIRVSRWSPAAEKAFGWTAEEVLGRSHEEWKFIPPTDAEVVYEAIACLRNGTKQRNISFGRNYRKDGSIAYCEWYNSALYSDSGELVSVLSLILDVTERFCFLEALRQSEERFRLAAECASDLIYEWDVNSGIVLWFGHIDEHLGYAKGELPRTIEAWKKIIHPDDRDRVLAAMNRHLQTREPFFEEYRVLHREGRFLYWINRGTAVCDERGKPYKWIGVTSNISERKQAEVELTLALVREQAARQLAEAKERDLRSLAEAIPQMVWSARPDGLLDYFNQRWFDYTGLEATQSQGWGWLKVLHPDDVEKCLDCWQRALSGEEDYEIECRFRQATDGVYRWHLGRAMPVRSEKGEIVKWFGTCTDIDDRKRVEEGAYFLAEAIALLSSSLDYKAMFQRLANLAVPPLADWCCVHLLEADGSIRLLAVAHSDPHKVELMWEVEKRQPVDPQERHGVAKVLRTGESKVYAEIPDSVLEAVAPSADWLKVLREYDLLSAMCVPLIARGRTLGVISLLSGESQRRYSRSDLGLVERLAYHAAIAIDNARLYSEAQEANQIKDEFLAILSHELRTPLNIILGWSQILQQRQLSPDKRMAALETIERNARLQTQMIEDLLDVSRIISGKLHLKFSPVGLRSLMQVAIETIRPEAEAKQIQILTTFCEDMGVVDGDPSRLQQVVWNLLSNAVKFTPSQGQVEVILSLVKELEGDREALERWGTGIGKAVDSQLTGKGYAQIQVRDTGIGIHPKFLPFVFDRFRQADSTSTRAYGGLGLGLAIVRHLVELHGGQVWATSSGEGQGATFTVCLPLWTEEPNSQKDNPGLFLGSDRSSVSMAGLRVLIVDDEPDTRRLLVTAIEQEGGRAIAVASTAQALDVLNRTQPDILVSDIGMPGEDGYALIQKVRKRTPEQGGCIPAVALTAYASEKDRQQAIDAGFSAYVRKPVEPTKVLAVVAELVGCQPQKTEGGESP